MYTVILRNKQHSVHFTLSIARAILIDQPMAHIRYSSRAIRKYESSHEVLTGDKERGKKKREEIKGWRHGYRLQSRNS